MRYLYMYSSFLLKLQCICHYIEKDYSETSLVKGEDATLHRSVLDVDLNLSCAFLPHHKIDNVLYRGRYLMGTYTADEASSLYEL